MRIGIEPDPMRMLMGVGSGASARSAASKTIGSLGAAACSPLPGVKPARSIRRPVISLATQARKLTIVALLTPLLLAAALPMSGAVSDRTLVPFGSPWLYCETELYGGCEPDQLGEAPFGGGDQATCSANRPDVVTSWNIHSTLGTRTRFVVPAEATKLHFDWRVDDDINFVKVTPFDQVSVLDPETQGNCDLAVHTGEVSVGPGGAFLAGEVVTLAFVADDKYTHGMSYADVQVRWS